MRMSEVFDYSTFFFIFKWDILKRIEFLYTVNDKIITGNM